MAYSSSSPGYDSPPLLERHHSPYLTSSNDRFESPPPITASSLPTTSHQNSSAYFDNSRTSAQPLTTPTSYSSPPNLSQHQHPSTSFEAFSSLPPTQPQYQYSSAAVSSPSPPPLPLRPQTLSPQPLYQAISYPTTDNRLSPYLSSSIITMLQQQQPPPPPPRSPNLSPYKPASGPTPNMYFPPPPPTPALRKSSSRLSFRGSQ
jgi:hypothetical protein